MVFRVDLEVILWGFRVLFSPHLSTELVYLMLS